MYHSLNRSENVEGALQQVVVFCLKLWSLPLVASLLIPKIFPLQCCKMAIAHRIWLLLLLQC